MDTIIRDDALRFKVPRRDAYNLEWRLSVRARNVRTRPIPDAQDDCIEACLRGAISQSLGLSRSDVARTAEELWGTDAQD